MSILADKIEIRIDGKTYNNDYVFSEIRLIQEIQRPNEFRFLMYKDTLAEDENDIRFSLSEELLGKKVEFSLNTKRDDENGEIHQDVLDFSGIIFNVNALRKNIKAGIVIEVTAYSPDYLLFDNPHCYSYENETLKNIVAETLKPYDIPIQNNPRTADEIPYTVQYNETNYAFINRLALRFGEWLYYDGKELVFGKIKKADTLELHPGYDILNYRYRLDTKHLNFTHAHHNYLDYGNTRNDALSVTGQAMHNMTDIVYKHSKSIYSKETFQHLQSSAPEGSFDETEYAVNVQGWGKKAQMMMCRGNTNRADLRIGSTIKINEYFESKSQKMSSCSHDELLICKVTHTTDSNGNYENEFTAIPADCEYPPYTYSDCYPKAGSQRAVVTDNQDPENLGRVRVQFLWQQEQDDSLMTPWIRIAQPHGGDNKGFYFIPEINEEVMVGFENGNAEKPYVIGTLYHGQQHPGSNWPNDSNDIKAIRTRNGHTIEYHDVAEGGFIRIYDNEKENYILTFSTDEKLIKLESTGNIELSAKKNVVIDAGDNIVMNAGKNIIKKAADNVSIEAGKNISASAGKDMDLDAENNMTESAGKDLTIGASGNAVVSISKDMNFSVGQNMDNDIGKNLYTNISEKYNLKANNIEQVSDKKMSLLADKIEQKAKSSTEINGGMKMDIKSNNTNLK